MTKYYFISYMHVDGNLHSRGHCVMYVKNSTLNAIARKIADINGYNGSVTITCLKELSEGEYDMLSGNSKC